MFITKELLGLVVLLIVHKIRTEDYEMDEPGSKESVSIDSESKEIYNYSSKEKPHKLYRVKYYNTVNASKNVNSWKMTLKTTPSYRKTFKKGCMIKNYDQKTPKENDDFKKSSYSYTVSIQKKHSHYASGALVHRNWILSVAQLFYNVRESIKLYKTRLGSVNCKKGGLLVPLKGIEIHPLYVYGQPSFDISLLKLAKPVEFTDAIRPICISEANGKIFKAVFLTTYWPRLIVQGAVLPSSANERLKQSSMRISTQPLIPRDTCKELLQAINISLDITSLCLETITSHHGRCRPDPGAPIRAEDSLWGITSGWTSEDCLISPSRSPTLVTRTSSHDVRSWIDLVLNDT